MKFSFLKILYVQVFIAITIGILLGYFCPDLAVKMKPLGTAFIDLIKMMIPPLIFCTIVHGIAGMESLKSVGRIGGITLAYFLILTTIALFIGLIVVNIVKPGASMNPDDYAQIYETNKNVAVNLSHAPPPKGFVAFVLNIIPKTFVTAFTSGEILQILLVAILFSIGLHQVGEKGKPILAFIDSLFDVIFKIINMIMRLAPLGAFGAISFTIGKSGIGSLLSLGSLILCFYITSFLFITLFIGLIAKLCGFNIFKFIRYLRNELLIVLGTASSESVLPNMLTKLERMGCQKSVVDLVIPTGYSFNLDGTAIYLTMAAMFLAQATNTPLDLGQQLTLLAILLISSKGAAAVTGGAFIVLTATLNSVGTIPPESIAIIFGIDYIMSEARALTNLIGNGVATVVVAKLTGRLDLATLTHELDNPGERA